MSHWYVGTRLVRIIRKLGRADLQPRRVSVILAKMQLAQIRALLQYPTDFWIGVFAMVLIHGSGFIAIWTIFSHVSTIGGWSLWEVALLYSLVLIPRGISDVMTEGVWGLRMLINQGELDRLLVRPMAIPLQVFTRGAGIQGIGSTGLGLFLFFRALGELQVAIHPVLAVYLLVSVISSVLLLSSLNLITNCIGFWEPASGGSFPFLVSNTLELAKIPISVYDRIVQLILFSVLPFAFVSYLPATRLLGRGGSTWILSLVSPFVGPCVAVVAGIVWHFGLKRYQGTGS